MKAQFQITEDDYVSAMKLHGWRQFARPSAPLLTLGAIVVAMPIIILLQAGGTILPSSSRWPLWRYFRPLYLS
jgi:hypothetical protein